MGSFQIFKKIDALWECPQGGRIIHESSGFVFRAAELWNSFLCEEWLVVQLNSTILA